MMLCVTYRCVLRGVHEHTESVSQPRQHQMVTSQQIQVTFNSEIELGKFNLN